MNCKQLVVSLGSAKIHLSLCPHMSVLLAIAVGASVTPGSKILWFVSWPGKIPLPYVNHAVNAMPAELTPKTPLGACNWQIHVVDIIGLWISDNWKIGLS